jgi:hypothetical protein
MDEFIKVAKKRGDLTSNVKLRNYLRSRRTMGETVSLLEQRQVFLQRFAALQTRIKAAS